jgi:hypothetical protein
MIMAHKLYENIVLESQINDILETKLNAQNLMTIDNDLTHEAGMIKRINTSTYEGNVEKVAMGEKNTERGKVTFNGKDYRVAVKQQVFDIHDEEVMQDPLVVQVAVQGAATEMVNDLNNDFFVEIAKTTTQHEAPVMNYDTVVDAIEKMNVAEDETGLFLLVGNDLKAQIRKDEDFKSARLGEMLFSGQIGSICGVPVVVSKKVPANTAFLATKEAVKCLVKRASQVEQDRDIETRTNTVVLRKVNLVALVDETKCVKITVNGGRAKASK